MPVTRCAVSELKTFSKLEKPSRISRKATALPVRTRVRAESLFDSTRFMASDLPSFARKDFEKSVRSLSTAITFMAARLELPFENMEPKKRAIIRGKASSQKRPNGSRIMSFMSLRARATIAFISHATFCR